MKFDGKNLKDGSKTVANVRGDKIHEGLYNTKKLGTMKDVDKAISGGGSGGTIKAALWVAVVR